MFWNFLKFHHNFILKCMWQWYEVSKTNSHFLVLNWKFVMLYSIVTHRLEVKVNDRWYTPSFLNYLIRLLRTKSWLSNFIVDPKYIISTYLNDWSKYVISIYLIPKHYIFEFLINLYILYMYTDRARIGNGNWCLFRSIL